MDEDILVRVVNCLKRVKDIPEAYDKDLYDLPLTGDVFKMSSTDMTYLLLEVMDEFKVRFEASDVENYGFNSICKIVKLVEGKLL